MRYNAVLFDLDGTVADSAPGILQSMKLALADFGMQASEDELRKYVGPPLAQMFADFLPSEQVSQGVAAYRKYYLSGQLYNAKIYPGVRETIISLYEDGCKVCLATAKPKETGLRMLEHFGLAEYFFIVGGVEEEKGICNKKHVIEAVKQSLNLPADEILMVGDRKDDLNAAAAAGISCVGAKYGYAPDGELEACKHLALITKPEQLLEIVEGDFLTRTTRSSVPPKSNKVVSKKLLLTAAGIVLLAVALLAGCLAHSEPSTLPLSSDATQSQKDSTVLQLTDDAGQNYIDETLFAGDSNTVRLCNFGEIELQNTVAYVGIGIQSVTEQECVWFEEYENPVTMPNAVSLLQPRRLIMMFGTNNISTNTEDFIAEYGRAYDAMVQAYPYTDIIISSVPPVGKSRQNAASAMKKITAFNEALVNLAAEKGAKFLNATEILCDDEGYLKTEYVESDGLHLTAKGAQAYITYVRTHSYVTKDDRPPMSAVPTRMRAPYMPSESEADILLPDSLSPTNTSQPSSSESSGAASQLPVEPQITPVPTPETVPESTPLPQVTPQPSDSEDIPAQGQPDSSVQEDPEEEVSTVN